MISDGNMKAIETAGLSFILGMNVPDVPYAIDQWWQEHPGQEIPQRARLHPALARRLEGKAP